MDNIHMFYVWRNRMGLKSKIKQYWLLFLENFMVAELQLFWVILRDFSLINCLVKISGDRSYGQSLGLYVAAYFRFLYLIFPFHLWNYYNQQQKFWTFQLEISTTPKNTARTRRNLFKISPWCWRYNFRG